MGLSTRSRFISFIVLILGLVCGWKCFFETPRSSCYSIDVKYFGRSSPKSNENDDDDLSIRSFQIPFDRSQVDDLNNRLTRTRFYEPQILQDDIHVNRSTYGFNRRTAEMVRKYFLDTFDWKKIVKELNQFEHFKTKIVGLDIHFVRVSRTRSNDEQRQAILFLHGWPGSFIEYLDVARLLNASTSDNYDLIIPSLPGYGYSDAPVQPGMNTGQIARIFHILMQRLGHTSYVVCGGDWGASIGTFMAQLYPSHVRGLLITLVIPKITLKHVFQLALGQLFSSAFVLDNDEKEFLDNNFNIFNHLKFLWTEGGYFHLQATKPDTVGYALNDSPMGLTAYILEKWSRWSNTPSEVDQSQNSGLDRFTLDQLLTNVMIYWTTETITSSMRLYFEYFNTFLSGEQERLHDGPVPSTVPIAIVNYQRELLYIPRSIARTKYPNIQLWLFHKEGGHFAALEEPREYAADVNKFLVQLERK